MARTLLQAHSAGVHDLSRARLVQALHALHAEYGVYDSCRHLHTEDDPEAMYIDGVGWTCEEGLLMTICRHCCTQTTFGQTEDCATDHNHLPGFALCPTLAIVDNKEAPWRP
jgi:hypothetical protein